MKYEGLESIFPR